MCNGNDGLHFLKGQFCDRREVLGDHLQNLQPVGSFLLSGLVYYFWVWKAEKMGPRMKLGMARAAEVPGAWESFVNLLIQALAKLFAGNG